MLERITETHSNEVYSKILNYDVHYGKFSPPKQDKPFKVFDVIKKDRSNKEYTERYFYGANGMINKDISNNGHNEKKQHGKKGEHAHDWIWENEVLISRDSRDLTDEEKEENKDILGD